MDNSIKRGPEEIWRMELRGEPWMCQLKADEGSFEASVFRGARLVSRRRFDRRELATWWAALERMDLVA
jgi:hypothetical protein